MKIQRVCWCVQCEEMLPKRCAKCVKHPERKPRIVELYGVPLVLSTNACGCVKIRCQRGGCLNTMWRHPRADGTLGHKNQFCSPACVRMVTAAARVAKRVSVPCSDGCGRLVVRPASNMRAKHAFFSQLCHYRFRVRAKAAARREELDVLAVQSKACYAGCRGEIVDHVRIASGKYECVRCRSRSGEATIRGEALRS